MSDLNQTPRAIEDAVIRLRNTGQSELADALALKLFRSSEPNSEGAEVAHELLHAASVQEWQTRILLDPTRLNAYENAIRAAVKPTSRVLDIGTGSGILAMMAARAGAAEVYTCETLGVVASAAKDIIAANGYKDRIRILNSRSTELDADRDLGGRFDVIVSAVMDNSLMAPNLLPTMQHAVRELLVPGGKMIPASGSMCVALAHEENPPVIAQPISGFDLKAFSRLSPPRRVVKRNRPGLQLKSEVAKLFHFDFYKPDQEFEEYAELSLRSFGGLINATAQWTRLQMDADNFYEGKPGPEEGFFALSPALRTVKQPFETAAGEEVALHGWHNRNRIRMWARKK